MRYRPTVDPTMDTRGRARTGTESQPHGAPPPYVLPFSPRPTCRRLAGPWNFGCHSPVSELARYELDSMYAKMTQSSPSPMVCTPICYRQPWPGRAILCFAAIAPPVSLALVVPQAQSSNPLGISLGGNPGLVPIGTGNGPLVQYMSEAFPRLKGYFAGEANTTGARGF